MQKPNSKNRNEIKAVYTNISRAVRQDRREYKKNKDNDYHRKESMKILRSTLTEGKPEITNKSSVYSDLLTNDEEPIRIVTSLGFKLNI